MLLGRYTLSATCTGYYPNGVTGASSDAMSIDVSSPGGFEHAKVNMVPVKAGGGGFHDSLFPFLSSQLST